MKLLISKVGRRKFSKEENFPVRGFLPSVSKYAVERVHIYGKDACSRMQFHRYSVMRSKVYSNTVVLFTLNHLGHQLLHLGRGSHR